MNRPTLTALLLLGVATSAYAGATPSCVGYTQDSDLLEREIRTRSCSVVLGEMYATWATHAEVDCWLPVLQRIASGRVGWIRTDLSLMDCSDAGATSMLLEALDNALETNASAVLDLALLRGNLDPNLICGSQVPTSFRAEPDARRAIQNRRTAVRRVNAAELSSVRDRCLANLDEVESQLPTLFAHDK